MEFTSIMKITESASCISAITKRPKRKRARIALARKSGCTTRAKRCAVFALIPDKLGGKRWDGGYRRLNERLTAVLGNQEQSHLREKFQTFAVRDRPIETVQIDQDRTAGDLATWPVTRKELEKLEKKSRPLANFSSSLSGDMLATSFHRIHG